MYMVLEHQVKELNEIKSINIMAFVDYCTVLIIIDQILLLLGILLKTPLGRTAHGLICALFKTCSFLCT